MGLEPAPSKKSNALPIGYVKGFGYLGDTLDGDGGADLSATSRIRNGWMRAFAFLTSGASPLKMKGRVYVSCVRSIMIYGSETKPLLADVGLKLKEQMIRWMCGVFMTDKKATEGLRKLVEVEPITTVLGSGRLRWYGYVMRKNDEDWVKKFLETWLESVESDMTELEIGREDV